MLALITRAFTFSCASRCSSNATQPLPRDSPYSADWLSPTTRMVAGLPCACATGSPSTSAAATATVQCASHARRAREERSLMSDTLIEVQRVTKQVADSTGVLTILHD